MRGRKRFTTQDVAQQFYELAKQEKRFEIQDALFSEDITSADSLGSEYLGYAAEKGEDWVKGIRAVHHLHTTAPIGAAHHFVAGRAMDLDVASFRRVQIHETMCTRCGMERSYRNNFFIKLLNESGASKSGTDST